MVFTTKDREFYNNVLVNIGRAIKANSKAVRYLLDNWSEDKAMTLDKLLDIDKALSKLCFQLRVEVDEKVKSDS